MLSHRGLLLLDNLHHRAADAAAAGILSITPFLSPVQLLDVEGIPTLVFLKPNGEIITGECATGSSVRRMQQLSLRRQRVTPTVSVLPF